MDLDETLHQLDAERRTLVRPGEVAEAQPHLVRLRSDDHAMHCVAWSALSDADADDAIRAEIEHHRRLGVSFEWKCYAHDGPADLLSRLRRHGFDVGPREAVMVYDLAAAPLPATPPSPQSRSTPSSSTPSPFAPSPVAVSRVDTAAHVEVFRRLAEAIFGKDYGFTATQLLDAIEAGDKGHRGYIAHADDGTPAGVGRLYTHPRSAFGGLYGGGTLPAYRGRGVYRQMVVARGRDAAARGARYLVVDALPTSRPILERMGFSELTATWPCIWPPATD